VGNFVNLYKIDKPAEMIFLADSKGVNPGPDYTKQIYQFAFSGAVATWPGRIHLRHNGLATVAFADGHASALDKTRIRAAVLAEKPANTVIEVVEEGGTDAVQMNP
jgi:prepilin-type processing-associated H-X9-DG protein